MTPQQVDEIALALIAKGQQFTWMETPEQQKLLAGVDKMATANDPDWVAFIARLATFTE